VSDQISEGLLSPFLRSMRIRQALPFIEGRILDIGCGSGELASHFSPEDYWGYDPDEQSIAHAREKFPTHSFSHELPDRKQKFNSIVLLAVIEHISDPVSYMTLLQSYLASGNRSSIILTTPAVSTKGIHSIGSRLGLFSIEADHEHKMLFNQKALTDLSRECKMNLIHYHLFSFGLNQLAVYKRKDGIETSPANQGDR